MITQTPPEKMTEAEVIVMLKKRLEHYQHDPEWRLVFSSALLHLEGAQADKGWQPIETVPKDGTVILLGWDYLVTSSGVAHWSEEYNDWYAMDDRESHYYTKEPTHWMPLPDNPLSSMAAQTEGERP